MKHSKLLERKITPDYNIKEENVNLNLVCGRISSGISWYRYLLHIYLAREAIFYANVYVPTKVDQFNVEY